MPAPTIPECGLMREPQIIGRKAVSAETAAANRTRIDAARAAAKKNPKLKVPRLPVKPRDAMQGVLPMSPSAWWAGVAAGKFPKPVKIGGMTAWRASDIRALVDRLSAERAA